MKYVIIILSLFGATLSCLAQTPDPTRFADDVQKLTEAAASVDQQDLILFTGSSSVRMWKDLQERYPDKNIVNHGFGG